MRLFPSVLTIVLTLAAASFTQVQATRTWVSIVGDDVNICSRTAPCKTFAGAISKTAINGEINALDPGSFGAVTITKSITLDATGTFASILPGGTAGIIVNLTTSLTADPVATVRLRGLSINGTGSGIRSGIRGINVSSASGRQPKVYIEDVIVHGFMNEGLLFNANGGELIVKNSSFFDNGAAGIKLDSNGGNLVSATIEKTNMSLNNDGLHVEDNVRATVRDSVFGDNNQTGVKVVNVSASAIVQLYACTVSSNKTDGLQAGGSITFSTITVAQCMVTHNDRGLRTVSANGLIKSWGDNYVIFNTVDGAFSAPNLNTL